MADNLHEVLGTRQRNSPALGPFDHRTGLGFVPKHDGDYRDAINNRKASVLLLVHEIFGGMSPFASRHLRRLSRRAAEEGTDSTDYSQSYTAASFVSYYAQRISNNIVMYGADGPYVKVQQARDWLSKGWWCDKGGRSGAANGEGAFFLLSGALESNFFRVE